MTELKQRKQRKIDGHSTATRGLAVVELAVCLPILFLILFATIEACAMLQLKHNVMITAYEGARIGILPGADAALVQTQCGLLLDDRNVLNYTIAMNPDPSELNVGDYFTVTVSADCSSNAFAGGVFFESRSISETTVIRAE